MVIVFIGLWWVVLMILINKYCLRLLVCKSVMYIVKIDFIYSLNVLYNIGFVLKINLLIFL